MTISKENKEFLSGLIDYYISEAQSYKQIAEMYSSDIESVTDTAFGIIVGCVYSGFLQAYSNQQLTANLEDIQEFHYIVKERASSIKKAITGDTAKEGKNERAEEENDSE